MNIADSKEVGLAIGQILGSKLFGFDDLHYGYWPHDLPVHIRNFARAQELYSDWMIGQIPSRVKRILDVGAGSGTLAQRLLEQRYSVDCVSPSYYLSQRIRERLGHRVEVFDTRIENFKGSQKYDLILFGESFQYVDMKKALRVAMASTTPFGHILICDFFRKSKKSEGPLGGGHEFDEFKKVISVLPLMIVQETDITNETAPTMDMFNQILNDAAKPVRDLICGFIRSRHPTLFQFLTWKFRSRLEKIRFKYFEGHLSAANFRLYKTYRCLLLQKSADC